MGDELEAEISTGSWRRTRSENIIRHFAGKDSDNMQEKGPIAAPFPAICQNLFLRIVGL